MYTLVIDTSHERSLVSVVKELNVLLTLPLPFGLQSSSHLFPAIENGFQKLNLTARNLKNIIVSVGPGSFTGIRVGVAAAKGIASPLDIPLYGVCSLDGFGEADQMATLIDARTGGAFIKLFKQNPLFVPKEELETVLNGYEKIVGPNLQRFNFPKQEERDPDPLALIKNAYPDKELNLLYLRENLYGEQKNGN